MKLSNIFLIALLLAPVGFATCDGGVCATVGGPVHGPYLKQNFTYAKVDFLPHDTFVDIPVRVVDYQNKRSLELVKHLVESSDSRVPIHQYSFTNNLEKSVVPMVYDKRVFYYDLPGFRRIFPHIWGERR